MATWGVAEAKAKFSELVEQAKTRGPQKITRNGRAVAVVVSAEEWDKRPRPATLQNSRTTAEFLRASPLKESGIELLRSRSGPREVDL